MTSSGVPLKYREKYEKHLEDPAILSRHLFWVSDAIGREEGAFTCARLFDELDALKNLLTEAFVLETKREDERRLREFYEVLVYD